MREYTDYTESDYKILPHKHSKKDRTGWIQDRHGVNTYTPRQSVVIFKSGAEAHHAEMIYLMMRDEVLREDPAAYAI